MAIQKVYILLENLDQLENMVLILSYLWQWFVPGNCSLEIVLIFGRKTFNLQSIKLVTFLSFFQCKVCILAYFTPWKVWNMFKVNIKGTRISKVNDKVKNKYTVDVVLVPLLLNLNTFHVLLPCFFCWRWSVNCWLELLLVVLTLCAC